MPHPARSPCRPLCPHPSPSAPGGAIGSASSAHFTPGAGHQQLPIPPCLALPRGDGQGPPGSGDTEVCSSACRWRGLTATPPPCLSAPSAVRFGVGKVQRWGGSRGWFWGRKPQSRLCGVLGPLGGRGTQPQVPGPATQVVPRAGTALPAPPRRAAGREAGGPCRGCFPNPAPAVGFGTLVGSKLMFHCLTPLRLFLAALSAGSVVAPPCFPSPPRAPGASRGHRHVRADEMGWSRAPRCPAAAYCSATVSSPRLRCGSSGCPLLPGGDALQRSKLTCLPRALGGQREPRAAPGLCRGCFDGRLCASGASGGSGTPFGIPGTAAGPCTQGCGRALLLESLSHLCSWSPFLTAFSALWHLAPWLPEPSIALQPPHPAAALRPRAVARRCRPCGSAGAER